MQLRASTFDVTQALQNDAEQPALGFTLTWHGLAEGLMLACDEPVTGGVPALFVGDTFARVNQRNGAVYRRSGATAVVRRAALDEKQYGNHTLFFLALPYAGESQMLAHVKTAPPTHYKKFRHKMWVGVRCDAEIKLRHTDEECPDRQEYLLSFGDKKIADVFLADGRVIRLRRSGDKLIIEKNSVDWQAAQRVGFAGKRLQRDPRDVFALFQLIGILDMAGAHSERVFDSLYQMLAEAATKLMLRNDVLDRFLETVQRRKPALAATLNKKLTVAKLSCLGTVKS